MKQDKIVKNEYKPKLLIATDNFLPRFDGITRFLSTIISPLQHHFDITVIAPDFGHWQHTGYHLVKIPLRKGQYGDMAFAKIKYWLIKKEVKKADIVFSQTVGPVGGLAIISARKLRKPVVSYVHSHEAELIPMAIAATPFRRHMYWFMRRYTTYVYNKVSLIITPSEWVDDQLSWQGVNVLKKVVRLGVDTKKFSPSTALTLRRKLGIDDEDIVIGQVGRLAREKDLKTLLRAFIRIQKKHSNVKLLVVADGMQSIKNMLMGRKGVILPGKQENIQQYYRTMDIFVLSSLTETTCLAALEAMSSALPIVSTPVGFVKDYITEGKNGYFFPFRDAYKLANHLDWLIKHPTIRKKLGHNARELVVKEFSWDKTIQSIRDVLLNVSTQKKIGLGKKIKNMSSLTFIED